MENPEKQGDAERALDRLHEMVENKLQKEFLENPLEGPTGDALLAVFAEFRKNLIGLTDVTHSYFDKLVSALEKGLDLSQLDPGAGVHRFYQ